MKNLTPVPETPDARAAAWGLVRIPDAPAPHPVGLDQRVRGLLLGLAMGDALGYPTEGIVPPKRPGGTIRDYLPNRHAGWRAVGVPSDDTQLAFWTLAVLLERQRLDPARVMEEFGKTPVFGGGGTCEKAIARSRGGRDWRTAGLAGWGNGALMRIAPVLLPHLRRLPGGSRALWDDVAVGTTLTHACPSSLAACVGHVGLLAELLALPLGSALPSPRWVPETFLRYAGDLDGGELLDPEAPQLRGTRVSLTALVRQEVLRAVDEGWELRRGLDRWYSASRIWETVPAVLFLLAHHAGDAEEAIVRAVNDTKDNDSIAAIVGAAVGVLHGASALPQRWHDGLLGRTRAADDGQVQALADEAVRRWA